MSSSDAVQVRNEIFDFVSNVSLVEITEDSSRQFDELFVALARIQASENTVYQRLLQSLDLGEKSVTHWQDTYPIPVQFFKGFDLRSYSRTDTSIREYRWDSSGTTGVKSRTHLHDVRLYDKVIKKLWEYYVLPFEGTTYRLIPDTDMWPNSSLAHFFTVGLDTEARSESVLDEGYTFHRSDKTFTVRHEYLLEKALSTKEPVRLCGTSYAIASFLDYLAEMGEVVSLPPGSAIIDTGGYKGIVLDRTRGEFLDQAEYYLGVPNKFCQNEYGMSELSSHFWSTRQADIPGHELGEEWWAVPPWVRVRTVDPFTHEDQDRGVGVFYDLANVWSCCAIQTQDLVEVKKSPSGIQYVRPFGRVQEASLKGCSITAEQMSR